MNRITNQAMTIYQAIQNRKQCTAKEIADELGILPNSIYRPVKTLEAYGFIKKVGKYPVSYVSQHAKEPIDRYVSEVGESLFNTFNTAMNHSYIKELEVSFIKDRNDFIERSNTDLQKVAKEASLIVSGLEVPAETILEYKKAVDREVLVRVIVQNMNEVQKNMLATWRKMGMQVRYFPTLEARIAIFDSKIVYFTSYDPHHKNVANGVRFNNAPIARIIQELFNSRWAKSKNL